jgi:ATP-dependent DNA helicase RecG
MIVDGRPTMSAVLLFCPYPQAYFPQLTINAISIPGVRIGDIGAHNERFTDNKRIEGTLEDMLTNALVFIKNNMKVRTIVDANTGIRTDTTDYPMVAIREVILNALIHRDYSIHAEGMPIQLIMYENRMEVKNPGGLYGRITLDQLGKIQPDTRNPVLATSMELLSLTENRYSGIPTIYRVMREAGNPDPVFESSRGLFTVTLYKRTGFEQADVENLSESEIMILAFCKTPKTRKELAEYFGFKSVAYFTKNYVFPLVAKNLLVMSDPQHPKSSLQTFRTHDSYR